MLAAFIGPLYGILVCDFYLIKKQQIEVDELFNDKPGGRYWYRNGVNPAAVKALVPATLIGILIVLIPALNQYLANFSLFIGMAVGGVLYKILAPAAEALRLQQSNSE